MVTIWIYSFKTLILTPIEKCKIFIVWINVAIIPWGFTIIFSVFKVFKTTVSVKKYMGNIQ
jgi:hypothetical protein